MDDSFTQGINNLLSEAHNEQNRRQLGRGWISQEEPTYQSYQKAIETENGLVQIMVDIQKPAPYASVQAGHVRDFSIWFDIETSHQLGGGNKYFAEVHEGTGPFECIERPMTEKELTTLYSTFKSELEGFEQVRRGCLFFGMNAFDTERGRLKPVIIKDLEDFYSKAMEELKG